MRAIIYRGLFAMIMIIPVRNHSRTFGTTMCRMCFRECILHADVLRINFTRLSYLSKYLGNKALLYLGQTHKFCDGNARGK